MKILIVILTFAVLAHAAAQAEKIVCPMGPPKQISIKQGEYSPTKGTTIQLENFVATIVPQSNELPLCFKNLTLVQSGSIFLDSESLSKLFNARAAANSKMKDIKISSEGQNLSITGTVHKVVAIHFQIQGPVKPAAHGDVHMQVESTHAGGMSITALMSAFGSDLGSLTGADPSRGVSVEKNTVIFHTEQLMNFKGEIIAVHVLKNGVKLDFGSPEREASTVPPKQAEKTADTVPQTPTHKIR